MIETSQSRVEIYKIIEIFSTFFFSFQTYFKNAKKCFTLRSSISKWISFSRIEFFMFLVVTTKDKICY